MPDLQFKVTQASAVADSASPLLAFRLEVENIGGEPIHTVVLRCQIQIEATRRRYGPVDQQRLRDLFGEPERWSQTLRTMLWTHSQVVIPSFSGNTVCDLLVPCTFDFNVAATKYFAALQTEDVPLFLTFSGSVFYQGPEGALQVSPISWNKEARFRLPLDVWRAMMELYYPNTAWLCIRKDVFDRLHEYKMLRSIPTWEETFERLMATVEEALAQ